MTFDSPTWFREPMYCAICHALVEKVDVIDDTYDDVFGSIPDHYIGTACCESSDVLDADELAELIEEAAV